LGTQWELDGLGFGAPVNPFSRAAWELWWGTQNTVITETELETRLAAYRDARDTLRQERDQTETDLKAMLTPREEAILMGMGYLR
jgi:hypothetical protein